MEQEFHFKDEILWLSVNVRENRSNKVRFSLFGLPSFSKIRTTKEKEKEKKRSFTTSIINKKKWSKEKIKKTTEVKAFCQVIRQGIQPLKLWSLFGHFTQNTFTKDYRFYKMFKKR